MDVPVVSEVPAYSNDDESVVLSVLRANDLHKIVGSDPKDSKVEVCRIYVRTAILVHPRGNAHPEAPRAFAKVACAWMALGDESRRLAFGLAAMGGQGQQLSGEEASRIFSSAIEMCAAQQKPGSRRGDFSEILQRAKQLSEPAEIPAMPSPANVAGGLALCTGLFAASRVASCTGHPLVGTMMRNAAMWQGVSQVAINASAAAQQPRVRSTLASVSGAVHERFSGLQGVSSKSMRQCGVVLGSAPCCIPRHRGRERVADGTWVRLVGLTGAQHLNGKEGQVVSFNGSRYSVILVQRIAHTAPSGANVPTAGKLVKRENLEILPNDGQESPPTTSANFI